MEAPSEMLDEQESDFVWGAPDEDLCPRRDCGGVLHDASIDVEGRDNYGLPLNHSAAWRQCGRCGLCCSLEEETEAASWAVA